jgi:hypothetical protein
MAVVGKVGTYAQVQPLQGPDFGKMVKDQFDKMDAEDKAAKAAKAKADKEKEDRLSKLVLPSRKTSNVKEMNKQINTKYDTMTTEYEQAIDSGDMNRAKMLINSVGSLNNAVDFFNKKYDELSKSEGKYNPRFVSEFETMINSIDNANSDVEYKGNGLDYVKVYKDSEKKEVLVEGNLPEILNSINIPYKFDADMLNSSAKSFVKTFPANKIESIINQADLYGTKSIETAIGDESIESELRRQAKSMVENRNSRALYASDKNMSLFRLDNFDEKEKQDAEEYFYKVYKDAFRNEIDYAIQQKRGSGSGGAEDYNLTSSILEVDGKYTMANDSSDGELTMKPNSISFNLLKKGGVPVKVEDKSVGEIIYDPSSKKMIFSLASRISGSSGASGDGSKSGIGTSMVTTNWYSDKDELFNTLKNSINSIPQYRGKIKTKDDILKHVLGIDPNL